MSEFMHSADLAWEAARAANQVFDQIQQAEAPDEQAVLTVEFVTLQAMAGVVFAPSPVAAQEMTRQQEAIVRRQLATPCRQLVSDLTAKAGFVSRYKSSTHNRIFNIIEREDAPTLRDVLVIGRAAVSEMRNLGSKGVDFLQEVVQAVDPRLEWPKLPTVMYAAKLCSTPDQVPARAVDPEFDDFFVARTGVDTLAGLIGLNVATLTQAMQKKHAGGKTAEDISMLAQRLYRKTLNYAREFDEAVQVREQDF